MRVKRYAKVVYPRQPDRAHEEFVVEVESKGTRDILEEVFRQMNIVYGTELPAKLGCRSMSCGDLVLLDGGWFVCEPTGWHEVSPHFAYNFAITGTFLERSFGVGQYVKAHPELLSLLPVGDFLRRGDREHHEILAPEHDVPMNS